MKLTTIHYIVDRKPKRYKKLYPGVMKLHGLIGDDTMKEIRRLQRINSRSQIQERKLQDLLAGVNDK